MTATLSSLGVATFAGLRHGKVCSTDERFLASVSEKCNVCLFADSTSLSTLEGHTSWVKSLAFSSDGKVLASGSVDETVRLWQVADRCFLCILAARGVVNSIAFSSDGHLLAVLQLIVIYFTPWGETNDRLLPVSTTHDS